MMELTDVVDEIICKLVDRENLIVCCSTYPKADRLLGAVATSITRRVGMEDRLNSSGHRKIRLLGGGAATFRNYSEAALRGVVAGHHSVLVVRWPGYKEPCEEFMRLASRALSTDVYSL